MAIERGYDLGLPDVIDPMYMNEAICEMNKKTEELYSKLSRHVYDLNEFIDAVHLSVVSDQSKETIKQKFSARPSFQWPPVPAMLLVPELDSDLKCKQTKEDKIEDHIAEIRRSLLSSRVEWLHTGYLAASIDGQTYTLKDLQDKIQEGAMFLDFTDNFELNNIFIHGQWLTLARESFKQGKKNKTLVYHSNKFVDWVEEHCDVKKKQKHMTT